MPSFTESFFPTSSVFLAFVFWFVNCTSLAYKLRLTSQTSQATTMSRHNVFLTCLETESNLYLWDFRVAIYGKLNFYFAELFKLFLAVQ